MKKVLIISYYFPPRPAVASVRIKGLAKYLPEFGYLPVILTAELPETPDSRYRIVQTYYPGDAIVLWAKRFGIDLTGNLREKTGDFISSAQRKNFVFKKLINYLKDIVEYPDNQKAWRDFAVKEGGELLEEEQFDVIISSSPPPTAHLIARELKKLTGVPWIADLRDLWSQNYHRQCSSVRRVIERRLERRVLSDADALVSVSEPLVERLNLLHRDKKVYVVTNGFDPEEMKTGNLSEDFTISYTGNIIERKQDPTLFFRAMRDLIAEKRIDSGKISIKFFGPKRSWLDNEIRTYGLENIVFQYGMVDRNKCLNRQRESQLLLLLNWNDPRDEGVYTGKVFEYLAARRPILAVGGADGVITSLMKETGAGVHISDLNALKEVIIKYYKEFIENGSVSYSGNIEKVMRYSHYEMAKKFAGVIESIT